MPTKSDHPPPHPKLTNSKKDNKKHPPPPVLITDRDVGVQYVREDDERRAFLGEVSWGFSAWVLFRGFEVERWRVV
jgi:hypothetical protein